METYTQKKKVNLGKGEKWIGQKAEIGKLLKTDDHPGIQKDKHKDMPSALF